MLFWQLQREKSLERISKQENTMGIRKQIRGVGNTVTRDEEKAEVLSPFFASSLKARSVVL